MLGGTELRAHVAMHVAAIVDLVGYSRPDTIDEDGAQLGRECELWSTQVGRIAGDTLSTRERLQRYFKDWR